MTKLNTEENKMGVAPVFSLLVSMSIPAIFSMLIQSLYNVVDSVFVAKYSANAFTAVSLAYPIQVLIIAVSVGTGVGINSLVSRKLGEKNKDEATTAANHSLILALLSWIVFALFGIFFSKMFIGLFTTNPEIKEMGATYLRIVTLMSFGIFISINIEKVLQSTGDMKHPMIMQLIGAITNIILDPILIFGYLGFPRMGIMGAALATVIGQILSMLYAVYVITHKTHEIEINLFNMKLVKEEVKNIYTVAFPTMIMQSITSLLVMVLNKILAGFAQEYVDVLGIYFKVQSFIFMPVFGLTSGALPIMGYNYGAKNRKRLIDSFRLSCIIAVSIMMLGTILFTIFPGTLISIFSNDETRKNIGEVAFRIIGPSFIFAGVEIVISTLFQSLGMGFKSLLLSALRQLVIIIPFAYISSRLMGPNGVWIAFNVSEIITLIVALLITRNTYNKHIKNL